MYFFFFCNDTATTEIYTLSLHDALPISLVVARPREPRRLSEGARPRRAAGHRHARADAPPARCGRAGRHHLVDRLGRGTTPRDGASAAGAGGPRPRGRGDGGGAVHVEDGRGGSREGLSPAAARALQR